jgi:hypothetical protein
MLWHVDISEAPAAFMFRVKQFNKKMKGPLFFTMLGVTCPTTQYHIPEDLSLQ